MKRHASIWTVAFTLAALLAIATGVIALGGRESQATPSSASFRPSGTAAFAELLRRSGYEVRIESAVKPRLALDDVPIAFFPHFDVSDFTFSLKEIEEQVATTRKLLKDHIARGGGAVHMTFAVGFQDSSERNAAALVTSVGPSGRKAQVTWSQANYNAQPLVDASASLSLWKVDSQDLVSVRKSGGGTEVIVADGVLATNRFVDRSENAVVLLDSIRAATDGSRKVVFLESAFGHGVQPSLAAIMGRWAEAAWLQLAFLFVVLVYVWGRPFGLPTTTRRRESGSRELIDAVADTYRRGKMTRAVIRFTQENATRFVKHSAMRTVNEEQLAVIADIERFAKSNSAEGAPNPAEDATLSIVKRVLAVVGQSNVRPGTR